MNSTFQVKIGIRNIVMPGQRRQTIVAMKLTAPSVVLTPDRTSPMAHRSPPWPGLCTESFRGGDADQPQGAGPALTR